MIANENRRGGRCALKSFCSKDYENEITDSRKSKT